MKYIEGKRTIELCRWLFFFLVCILQSKLGLLAHSFTLSGQFFHLFLFGYFFVFRSICHTLSQFHSRVPNNRENGVWCALYVCVIVSFSLLLLSILCSVFFFFFKMKCKKKDRIWNVWAMTASAAEATTKKTSTAVTKDHYQAKFFRINSSFHCICI